MRTRTVGERNLIKGANVNHHLRAEVQNIDRTWKELTDLEGEDWVEGAEIRNSLDQPCANFTLMLKRATVDPQELSAAPTWGASPLNRDDTGLVYAPLLEAGRNVRIWSAVTARGVAPVAGDWKLMLHGRIDKVAWEQNPIKVIGRDLSGWLINTQIESEIAYATDDPTAVEVIMQAILDDWPSGIIAPTLDTPTSPGWIFNNGGDPPKTQVTKSVLEALQQDWALSIGWQCRYLYDDTAEDFVLKFYMIDRDNTTPVDEFAPTEYKDITSLEITDEFVRNRIKGTCFGPDGETIERTIENTTSQSKYGIKFAGINLAKGDPVDSESELDTLLTAAVHDLGAPFAQQTMETLLYWPVELGDLYTFKANADHYDDDQLLAVVAYTHRWQKGEAWTTMDCNGKVIGSFHAWFRKGVSDDITPEEETESLNNFKWTDSADGLTRTFSMIAGSNVHRVAVFDRLMEVPPLTDPWPTVGAIPATILVPDPVTREVTYAVTKPSLLTQRFIQFEPRLVDWSAGPVRRAVVDPSPTALDVALHAEVTNITADLTAIITGGTADWPVTVEFFEDSPNGVAFASKEISANATLNKLTAGLSALGARTLPQREARRWWVKLTNVAGEEFWATTIADRDSLAYGYATVNDFRAAPAIVVTYDDDTDVVKFILPGGKTKTFSGLSGSGSVTYTVGDAVDVGSPESALAIDETRSGYSVQVQGGGEWTTIFEGKVHGATTGPSLTVTPTPGNPDYSLAYSGTGTITYSVDGGAYSTPPASPITITRHATADKTVSFKCVQAGQTIIDSVTIPSLASVAGDTDTVTPDLTVTPGTRTDTSQQFTVTATNPAGGAAPTITVTPYNTSMVIGGVTYTTAQTVASGTVVTVNRPATTATEEAHIRFRASIATGGAEDITISVPKQTNFGPSLIVTATPGNPDYTIAYSGTGTITLSIDGGAYGVPAASPITVARHATNDKTYSFKCVKDNQTFIDTVIVPCLESDTVSPNLLVTPGTPTSTTQPYTITASNPSGGAAPTITVTPFNTSMVIGGVTYTTTQTIASGTVVTVNRPVTTETGQAHIVIVATLAGGGTRQGDANILAQLNIGPTLVVTPTPGSSSYDIAYSGNGTITYSIDGGSYTTPPASPIGISRGAAGTTGKTVAFKAVLDGQTVTDSVTVPAIDQDTVTPDLTVTVGTPAASTQPYTVSASNPSGGAAPTITVTPYGCDMVIGGVTYSTAQTVSNGTTVTVNRPSSTQDTQAHVKFRASIAGGGAEEIVRTVPYQLNLGPTLIVNTTPGSSSYLIDYSGIGTITYSIDGGSFTTPPSSPITVTRDGNNHTYVFKSVRDGQTIVAQVDVPLVPPVSAEITGISGSITYAPCDGGGTIRVTYSSVNFPAGTTYDIYVTNTGGGTYDGNSNSSLGNTSSPVDISVAFCPGDTADITIIAKGPGGNVLGSAIGSGS